MTSDVCPKCEGCGVVADTPEQEPWTSVEIHGLRKWEGLPLHAGLTERAKVMPMICPRCRGARVVSAESAPAPPTELHVLCLHCGQHIWDACREDIVPDAVARAGTFRGVNGHPDPADHTTPVCPACGHYPLWYTSEEGLKVMTTEGLKP